MKRRLRRHLLELLGVILIAWALASIVHRSRALGACLERGESPVSCYRDAIL